MKKTFKPRDPRYIEKVKDSWEKQEFLRTIGCRIDNIAPGFMEISLPIEAQLAQAHGFVSGSIIGALADVAGGYAAYTVTPAGITMLTAEYKINFINPARGDRLVGRGYLIKPGSRLSVARSEVYATSNGSETQVAEALMTMISLPENDV